MGGLLVGGGIDHIIPGREFDNGCCQSVPGEVTDHIEELAKRLAKTPDPAAEAYLSWTLRRVYATFGIPDSVWNGKDETEWTYQTKQGDLRLTFTHGRVTSVRI